ncbi:synembryn-A [Boleophthalmus pectinirostris]|uniref:synembryn-A n=1 Tax=Boleophthalmus pectinirostris TaxID=150288 RepID=UPI00242B10CE|nr:synembryn-A [Boleophthalmus pectinirostris]XP_055006214.1 synembryn-A [Boleophthalmus pectinirostris]
MEVDLEGIIQCIKSRDKASVQLYLQEFNKEYAQCFFFDKEERNRRKQRRLEEFKKNKVRDYTDSDSDGEEYEQEDRDLFLRQNLALVLVGFIRNEVNCSLLTVALRSLRILSRDKRVLAPLVTDSALLTLARLAGLTTGETHEEPSDPDSTFYDNIIVSLAEAKAQHSHYHHDSDDMETVEQTEECTEEDGGSTGSRDVESMDGVSTPRPSLTQAYGGSTHQKELERGRRDRRESKMEGEGDTEEESGSTEEAQRKEAMKVLCNVVYNSSWAQERFSALRLINGLIELLSAGISSSSPSSVQFYELRLMFLMTALRPELGKHLQQAGGVSIFTAALESCLEVQWNNQYQCILDTVAPPISLDTSQRIVEILKILFNITFSTHRQEPTEEAAAQYRHLVAILHLCLMRKCVLADDTDELQGHTVNLLSALPLQCLDVLLNVPLTPCSEQFNGVNMDSVHKLLLFMERRLEQGDKVKEKLTPILNLLTESCRAHRETRKYLRNQILPPLRDVSQRPEEGSTVKSRIVRLMTHLDTDLKHCAADLIFVLCKENVRRFVKYTGYGNAAGLLATRGLLGGQNIQSISVQYSSDSDSDTEEYRQQKDRINPVTGRVEALQPDPMEGMSEDEKEEEARRLIKLFSKLSREDIIQPMGVDSQGRLVPMAGLKENITDEGHSDSDFDEEK